MHSLHLKRLLKNNRPTLISAAVHLGAFIALLLTGVTPETRGEFNITWKDEEPPLEFISLDLNEPAPSAFQEFQEGSEDLSLVILEAIPETTVEIPDFGSDTWSPPVPIVFSDESFHVLEEPALATGETEGSEGIGASAGKETANGQGSTFFGIKSEEKRIVFVLDASLSMAGARWQRLVEEMVDTIASLNGDMEFSVIFFNTRYREIKGGLQTATDQNKIDAIDWLTSYKAGGRTNPLPALMRALELSPDAVYFLTDGDFQDYAVARTLRRIKRQGEKVSIHTIGLGNPAGNGKLFYLARASGGQFIFIDQ